MYLKALKLHGFKSFADPTELRFEPGVTVIVGPNGCGKSNIADSIRWVLGEQSAKALRGGKMHDVIFEGTDTRKPHSMCEVSLLLTDCEQALGMDFHEVEITRRVSRDGSSEYHLNGQPCRLKDIQKLFMDTGIGRTSYSIMAQGQIDQILSSKPDERRAVFEEAAGITRYKAQRREALGKLALTEQNLARVADVVTEVGRQIGSLRRQASKAMRFRRLNHRLRHLALAHDGFQYQQLRGVLDELSARLQVLRGEADTRRSLLQEHQASLESQKARRTELNQRVQEAQQAVFDLRSEREQAANQIHLNQVKGQGLRDRIASAQDDLGELEMQLKEVSDQATSGQQDRQMQLNLLGESDAAFQSKNRELALVEGELNRLDQLVQREKFQLLELESKVARLRTDCSALEVDQKTAVARHEQLQGDMAGAMAQREEATANLEQLRVAAASARSAVQTVQQEVADAQKGVQETTAKFRDAQRRLQEVDRSLAQKHARLKLLQQLQEKWEGFGEGAKALLQGRLTELGGGSPFAALTHGVDFRPEFAKASEALLGAAVEAVQVADLATAQAILARLENDKIGGAYLKVPTPESSMGAAPAELPEFLRPATTVFTDDCTGHPLHSVLASCYVADSLEQFLSFWAQRQDFSFLMVATPKGEWVDRRGMVFGGYQKRPASSIVQREIDIRETSREVAKEQEAHDQQKALIDQINAELAAFEQRLSDKRAEVQTANEAVATAQAEERSGQRALDEAEQRVARLERDVEGLESMRQEAEAKFAKAQAVLIEVDKAITAGRESIAANEAKIVEIRNARDVQRETLGHARLELAERRQRVEIIDRGLGEMVKRRQQLAELLEQRRSELEMWTAQVAELEAAEQGQAARVEELARTQAVAQESVEAIRRELAELEQAVNAVEGEQSSLRDQAETSAGELSQCEIRYTEHKARSRFLAEEAMREFSIDLGEVNWRLEFWKADDEPEGLKPLDLDEDDDEEGAKPAETSTAVVPADGSAPAEAAVKPRRSRKAKEPRGEPTEAQLAALDQTNWDQIRSEVQALRQRLNSMGAVNLVAIEEYAELKQRYDFLKTQSDDLISSKDALMKAIDEINATSLKQFALTFEQIRKNFAYTFQTLFNGGNCDLQLITQDDPLESGIDIIAQPPGTKLNSLTLLSGGQKTLTAVALLFALYLVKPSPFCLLDELDAPLDESNIERFTTLLKRFVDHSQFIIITHNKRTVAAANAIYGVTMQERGVSKTVSMRFNKEAHSDTGLLTPIAESVRSTHSDRMAPALPAQVAVSADPTDAGAN
ncbi:MAG TPA: chromosome segregation protein SMC [Opitutaceae bacterium]|nr:chromosome segregation protein SMC [Opitutaceae bacterium]